jgi:hypothetical protein
MFHIYSSRLKDQAQLLAHHLQQSSNPHLHLRNPENTCDHTKFDGGMFSPLDKGVFYLLHCVFLLIIYTPLQHLTIPSLTYYPLLIHPPQSHTFTYMIFFPHPLPFRIRLSQTSMGSVLIRA